MFPGGDGSIRAFASLVIVNDDPFITTIEADEDGGQYAGQSSYTITETKKDWRRDPGRGFCSLTSQGTRMRSRKTSILVRLECTMTHGVRMVSVQG